MVTGAAVVSRGRRVKRVKIPILLRRLPIDFKRDLYNRMRKMKLKVAKQSPSKQQNTGLLNAGRDRRWTSPSYITDENKEIGICILDCARKIDVSTE